MNKVKSALFVSVALTGLLSASVFADSTLDATNRRAQKELDSINAQVIPQHKGHEPVNQVSYARGTPNKKVFACGGKDYFYYTSPDGKYLALTKTNGNPYETYDLEDSIYNDVYIVEKRGVIGTPEFNERLAKACKHPGSSNILHKNNKIH